MGNVYKQKGSIVLYKEERNGADYIRIEYAGDPAIALLLAQDTDVEKTDNGSAYMTAAAFKLPDFYDRYSPHAYIDYSRVYVRHPKPQRTYVLAVQSLDRENLPCLFQRLHGIPQGTEHRPPESGGCQ